VKIKNPLHAGFLLPEAYDGLKIRQKKIRNDWGDHCVEQRICLHSSVKENVRTRGIWVSVIDCSFF